MSEETTSRVTGYLDQTVTVIQTGIALFLVAVLLVGVVNLVSSFLQAAIRFELLGYKNAIGLINTTIDIVLYLFIVIELYRTIVAYVQARNVVRAVIHAGLIAVVRQIIIFKPDDAASTVDAFLEAATLLILLIGLLVGFYLVHEVVDDEEGA